jgi:single-stranded-DNA-specific exonuclease
MDIEADDVTPELSDALEMLSPFGNGNPKPIFRIKDVRLRDVRYMGVDGKHARFTVHEGNRYINCVLFNKAEEYSGMLTDGKKHDIAGSIESQYWQGQKRLQLIVENMID